MPCLDGCSGSNGQCVDGLCICNAGWTGANCTKTIPCVPVDCSGRGVCMLGTCNCHDGTLLAYLMTYLLENLIT